MKTSYFLILIMIFTFLHHIKGQQTTTKNISYGIPATNEVIHYIQPDGSQISYYLKGDGVINWKETLNGFHIEKANDNFYYYTSYDTKGNITIQNIRVSENKNIPTTAMKGIPYTKEQIERLRSEYIKRSDIFETRSFPSTGTNNLLLLLVDFPDHTYSFNVPVFDSMFNINNYNGTGSFRQYYLENSYGQLNVITTIRGWYTAPELHDYYAHEDSLYNDHVRELVRYIVDQAELEGVDFSIYDNDNDSVVDGIMVIHSGRGAETGDETNIWSHSWRLGNNYNVTYDGVLINDYTINPEFGSSSFINGIGTACHEFGHNLGIADYYDTNYGTTGQSEHLGTWDVMASGSYNNGANTPAHHNAYSKAKLDWLNIEVLDSTASNVVLPCLEYDTVAYRINTTTPNEFFLLENRQNFGFDQYIPGHGMLIYHIDENQGGAWNADASHQAFDLEEADGTTSHGASDAFPHGNTQFTDLSNPSSTAWSGYFSNKPVTDIVEISDTVYFNFMQNNLAPVAHFLSDKMNVCEGTDIEFIEDAAYTAITRTWYFEGGNPYTSTDKNPIIHYDSTGVYDVTLIVTNAFGNDTLISYDYINVGTPDAQFLNFDGSNDYVEVPALNLRTNTVTIEAFIRPLLSQENWAGIVFCRGDSTVAGLSIKDDFELRYHWNGGKYGWSSGLYVPTGEWTHVALVITPDSAIIYMDDTLAVNIDNHAPEEFNTSTRIAHDKWSRYFRGLLDEVRIWNVSRSAQELFSNRCSIPDPINETNLIAYYNFNECGGMTLTDQKSGLNGTLTNMTSGDWINGEPCDVSGSRELQFNNDEIILYPNPSSGKVSLKRADSKRSNIIVYNLQGAVVYKDQINTKYYQFDLGTMSSGIYTVCISSDEYVNYFKLILE